MKSILMLLVVLFLAWAVHPVRAESQRLMSLPQPYEITVADGLPSSTIRAISEDQSGYLWFASADGLARFDGRGYRIWRREDGLPDNYLWSLHVDASNQLWVGTRTAGLIRFSPDRRQLSYIDRSTHPILGSNTIFAITSTADGTVWFGTDNAGLYSLASDGEIRQFLPEEGNVNSLPSVTVGQLLVDDSGLLWVGTNDGAAQWDGQKFHRLDMSQLPDRRVNALVKDAKGQLWVGTPAGTLIRHQNGRLELASLDAGGSNRLLQMSLQDHRGDYWFDTSRGIIRSSDGRQIQWVPFHSRVSNEDVLTTISIAYEDRDGGLWFAMLEGGLWHLPANWRQFVQLKGRRDLASGLHNPLVESMSRSSRGGMWLVGSAGDLDHLDARSGEITHHLSSRPGSMWMRSVFEDSRGRVWIGRNGLLERYDPATKTVVQWTTESPDPSMSTATRSILQCDDANLWMFSGEEGLQQRNLDGRLLWSTMHSDDGLSGNDILSLACGPEQEFWVGTHDGIKRWIPEHQRFEAVPGSPQIAVHAIHLDGSSMIWIGGVGHIDQYRWRKDGLEHIDRIDGNHGFPYVSPYGIVADGHGIVWVASPRGLMRVDPLGRTVRLLGVHDGLRSQEFRARTLGLSEHGQVFAATGYGVVLVEHDEFFNVARRPPLVIESVSARLGDDRVDLTFQSPLQIAHGMQDVKFIARLLTFVDSTSVSYRFKLEGFDRDWVDVGPTGERQFSRLEPGNYQLLVQARTADNLWSSVEQIHVQVTPPWWRSPQGKAVFVVLGALILVLSIQIYRRRLKRSNELEIARTRRELAEQASQAKTQFLATLGHEVRTPLTGVLGMSELLLSSPLQPLEKGYARSIQQAGEHLLRLVNDALDLARIEAGKLDLKIEPVAIQCLLDGVMELMTPLARRKRLSLRQQRRLPEDLVISCDMLRLRQIALNLIGNAIKFTETGEVVVAAGVVDGGQGFWLEVSDTGPGMTEAQQARLFKRFEQANGSATAHRYGGSGLGLAISQELATVLGGSITLRSRLGEGACFRVELGSSWRMEVRPKARILQNESQLPPLQILLVEDDQTVADVIRGLLSERGHAVVHVSHGLAALTELVRMRFDIALLDLDLPGMDGVALGDQIRQMGMSLPLLAVTARVDADAALLVEEAGFHGFLRKPVSGKMLVEAIGSACRVAAVVTGKKKEDVTEDAVS